MPIGLYYSVLLRAVFLKVTYSMYDQRCVVSENEELCALNEQIIKLKLTVYLVLSCLLWSRHKTIQNTRDKPYSALKRLEID